jgi:hypothetical protein
MDGFFNVQITYTDFHTIGQHFFEHNRAKFYLKVFRLSIKYFKTESVLILKYENLNDLSNAVEILDLKQGFYLIETCFNSKNTLCLNENKCTVEPLENNGYKCTKCLKLVTLFSLYDSSSIKRCQKNNSKLVVPSLRIKNDVNFLEPDGFLCSNDSKNYLRNGVYSKVVDSDQIFPYLDSDYFRNFDFQEILNSEFECFYDRSNELFLIGFICLILLLFLLVFVCFYRVTIKFLFRK